LFPLIFIIRSRGAYSSDARQANWTNGQMLEGTRHVCHEGLQEKRHDWYAPYSTPDAERE
jgi:hypothetical protein